MNRTRGFTLIEASVVIMVIVILAGLIMPRIASMKSSRDTLSFIDGLPRIVSQAREAAISKNQTAKITYDQARQSLKLTLEAVQAPPTPVGGQVTNQAASTDTDLTTLAVPSSVVLDSFKVSGQTAGPSDFTLQFYPDGSCDGGSIETDAANRYRTLVVDTNGVAKLINGPTPTDTTDVWPAGTYVQRASTNAP